MSIKVTDLLNLPSMRNAKLIAGAEAGNNIVNSISVLETTNPALLNRTYFQHEQFRTDEILITGFINNPKNIKEQCDCIRGLYHSGASGLIIFYVGVFLAEVNHDLIDLANELGFPLLCMPADRIILYGEVITDVFNAINRDKQLKENFVGDFLERISNLPATYQTLDYLLRMISNRTQYSLALLDYSLDVLHSATWPISDADFFSEAIMKELRPAQNRMIQICKHDNGQDLHYVFCRMSPRSSSVRMLIIVSESEMINDNDVAQIIELIQLFISIWVKGNSKYARAELVHALIKNEPLKIRKLAEMFRIDVKKLKTMWILTTKNTSSENLEDMALSLEKFIKQLNLNCICAPSGDNVILFLEPPGYPINCEQLAETFLAESEETENLLTIATYPKLTDMTQAREMIHLYEEYKTYAWRLYPHNNLFTSAQILFAKQCMDLITEGEEAITKVISPLTLISPDDEQWYKELLGTLTTFLLDAGASVTQTANILYIHKSTIKYRLKAVTEYLGYNISKLPESYPLYLAVAIKRLLRQ